MRHRIIAAILALFIPCVGHTNSLVMRTHFIDVGQANATLLEFPCGVALIDAGAQDEARLRRLLAYLEEVFARRPELHKTIDTIFITHNHVDHTLGLREVIERFTVHAVIENGQRGGSGEKDLLWARKNRVNRKNPKVIDVDDDSVDPRRGFTSPDIDPFGCPGEDPKIRILGADLGVDPGWDPADYADEGNHSIVVRVDFGDTSFLFPGDLEEPALNRLAARFHDSGLLDVDVLEVAKHGSGSGATENFLNAVKPQVAVISAGRWDDLGPFTANSFGFPRLGTINRLLAAVKGFRPETVRVMVASQVRQFEPFVLDKAIYSTGWDGDIAVSASPYGELNVRVSGQRANAELTSDDLTTALDSEPGPQRVPIGSSPWIWVAVVGLALGALLVWARVSRSERRAEMSEKVSTEQDKAVESEPVRTGGLHNGPAPEARQHQVFISYSQLDEEAVVRVLEDLGRRGLGASSVFRDRENMLGARRITATIARAIEQCKVLLFFVSRNSVESPWVKNEIFFALKRERDVFPVFLEPIELPAELDLQLGPIHQVFLKSDLSAGCQEIERSLRELGVEFEQEERV